MKYRLYIDEVGNAAERASEKPEQRYLSLTGVAFELGYVNSDVFPALERLKQTYFGSHVDEPVILHRREIMTRKPPFDNLKDEATDQRFRNDLMQLLANLDYVVFTATIDKLEYRERYTVWRYDPYHYCLEVLVERYVRWLDTQSATGDVMVEARGDKEDKRLRKNFSTLYDQGTDYIRPQMIQARLTSKDLKVKPKNFNISGLQLADLIAYPSYRAAQSQRQGGNLSKSNDINGMIGRLLEEKKYYRSTSGRIDGWGRKWLP